VGEMATAQIALLSCWWSATMVFESWWEMVSRPCSISPSRHPAPRVLLLIQPANCLSHRVEQASFEGDILAREIMKGSRFEESMSYGYLSDRTALRRSEW